MVKLKDNCRDPSYLPFFPLDKSTVLKNKKYKIQWWLVTF